MSQELQNDYLIKGENIVHVIRNLRQARWELKHGFTVSCDLYLDYCINVLLQKKPTNATNEDLEK